MTGSNTTVTVETEDGTNTYPNDPWFSMHNLVNRWEAEGWRYSIRHYDDAIRERVTLTRYNNDGTIDRRITFTEEVV